MNQSRVKRVVVDVLNGVTIFSAAMFVTVAAGLIASRILHYEIQPVSGLLAKLAGLGMTWSAELMVMTMMMVVVFLKPLTLICVVGLVVFRRRLVRIESRQMILSTPTRWLLCLGVLLVSGLVDAVVVNFMYWIGATAVIAVLGVASHPRSRIWGLWGLWLFYIVCIWTVEDWTEALSLSVLAAGLMFAVGWRNRGWLRRQRDVALLSVPFLVACNLVPGVVGGFTTPANATAIADEMPYGLCASERHQHLVVSHPNCTGMPQVSISMKTAFETLRRQCQRGDLTFYDLETLQVKNVITAATIGVDGRLEQLVCGADDLVVAVNETGARHFHSVRVMPYTSVTDAVRLGARFGVGNSLTYDSQQDVVYLAGEFTHTIGRLELSTRTVNGRFIQTRPRVWSRPLLPGRFSGSFGLRSGHLDQQRRVLYASELWFGEYIWAFDLETGHLLRKLRHYNGPSYGLAVDSKHDRLYVSGFWGIDILDAKTGKSLDRKRMGFGTRDPTVSEELGLLFVQTSVEGKIRIYDLNSLAHLHTVTVGSGLREVLLLGNPDRLLFGNRNGLYVRRLDELLDGRVVAE